MGRRHAHRESVCGPLLGYSYCPAASPLSWHSVPPPRAGADVVAARRIADCRMRQRG